MRDCLSSPEMGHEKGGSVPFTVYGFPILDYICPAHFYGSNYHL